ncbi:MAG: Bicarbonate transport ATP-binding protein CmpD [Syntrophomonadaceae bacterium]|nr:Bicarbonate transport ATP-binding protein CmpD [Bacillota bacterium]MBT9147820.1 Bicarbonate transport ATP-binding protein CmpD [Bacillota bacterium]
MQNDLQIKNMTKEFNLLKKIKGLKVYEELSLSVPEKKVTCIMGPSGCGKTTLLNIISGLIKPDSGEFKGFDSKTVSYLFQEPRLLPWKTVWQNIDFVVRDSYSKQQRTEVITKYLKMVDLYEFRDYWPDKLSGGMKQRVSVARAFVFPSDLLLMDEPFKGLDMQLKVAVLDSFTALWQQDLRTVIFVTHDIDEALYLGDKIYFLSGLPAKVKKTMRVTIPREERRYGEGKLKDLKDELLTCFCGGLGHRCTPPREISQFEGGGRP